MLKLDLDIAILSLLINYRLPIYVGRDMDYMMVSVCISLWKISKSCLWLILLMVESRKYIDFWFTISVMNSAVWCNEFKEFVNFFICLFVPVKHTMSSTYQNQYGSGLKGFSIKLFLL